MTKNDSEKSQPYEEVENWPPYTYRDYHEVTAENMRAFTEFLNTENKVGLKMELQPWISFCDSRCSFCYFPNEAFSRKLVKPYLDALKKELIMYAKTRHIQTSVFDEVVLGGGSPTVLFAEELVDILSFCRDNFNLTDDVMVKVAGCTHNLTSEKLQAIYDFANKLDARCTQIDVGVQTFNDNIRKMLNIVDSAEEATNVIKTMRDMGLYACIDLMYNLPGETMDIVRKDIKTAVELEVEGIDYYALSITPETPLQKQIDSGKVPKLADSDTEMKMYLEAHDILKEAGYKPTGHSRFSYVDEHFKENCVAGWPWAGQLTTGSGCFMGYLGPFSYMNIEPAQAYIDFVNKGAFPIAKLSKDTKEDTMKKVMMRLYVRQNVDKNKFKEEFGVFPEQAFPDAIKRLVKKGLIAVDDKEVRVTEAGDLWRYNIIWEFCKK